MVIKDSSTVTVTKKWLGLPEFSPMVIALIGPTFFLLLYPLLSFPPCVHPYFLPSSHSFHSFLPQCSLASIYRTDTKSDTWRSQTVVLKEGTGKQSIKERSHLAVGQFEKAALSLACYCECGL